MKHCLVRLGLAAFACTAHAQDSTAAAESARLAIERNPEVAASFDALHAASDEADAATGAWYPRLNASADAGRRSYTYAAPVQSSPDFPQNAVRLELRQLLWDGLATSKEIERLDHAKMLRWFEFLDATERVGLAAARAWYEVVRERRFVALAEENYVQHKVTFDQVQQRVKAGVGRGVDLEQVAARIALAESGLVAERGRLHDAIERYYGIVGALPPAERDAAAVEAPARPLPPTQAAALEEAVRRSPAVAAAIESLRSARAAAEGRKSAFQPRVEARLSAADGHNIDGNLYEKHDAGAQVVLTWNLFNGGSDTARERQFASLLSQAQNLRDKACLDVRQSVSIAFNDVRRLQEQLAHLDRNVAAIVRARDAYRQQFEIGQRSLLDLLNAENELHDAKRAEVQAQADLATAIVRTHAGMGTLLAALGLQRPDAHGLAPEAGHWSDAGDAPARCPLQPVEVGGPTMAELDARARALEAARAPALPASGAHPRP
jgi:adhesin transport system outer membrane protein